MESAFAITTKNLDLSFLEAFKSQDIKTLESAEVLKTLIPLKNSLVDQVLTLYQCALGGGLVKLGLEVATDELYNGEAELVVIDGDTKEDVTALICLCKAMEVPFAILKLQGKLG